MKLIPMFDRVLVKKEAILKSAGGILIPETATSNRSDRATVVAVGRGKKLSNGNYSEPIVKAGDHVIFDKHRGFPVTVDGVDMTMIFEDDILGVCK